MATINKTDTGKWVVRYREPGGRSASQRERTFRRRAEAEAFRAKVEHDKLQGLYVDPHAARVTFGQYANEWMRTQPHRASTADTYERHLRRHVLPTFGSRPLGSIRRTEVQGWVKGLRESRDCCKPLAPSTVKLVYGIFASILRAAVQDGRIGKSPCVSIKLPDVPKTRPVLLAPSQVLALADAMAPRYRALVYLGAGAGLRQGEAFGVCRSRVRWLERMLRVDQQVVLPSSRRPEFGPPKTEASVRDVPLPGFVLDALSWHVAELQPAEALFTTTRGNLLRRDEFNGTAWRHAVRLAGLPGELTFHDLRHTFASTALAEGVPISDVSKWLGHASITETVDTYGHLLPKADERIRGVLDRAYGDKIQNGADLVLTLGSLKGINHRSQGS
jgi:integrase